MATGAILHLRECYTVHPPSPPVSTSLIERTGIPDPFVYIYTPVEKCFPFRNLYRRTQFRMLYSLVKAHRCRLIMYISYSRMLESQINRISRI